MDEFVKDIHSHYPTMGYRQVRDSLLLQTDLKACDVSVWKSMKRLGIKGYMRTNRYSYSTKREHIEIPNVLSRQFNAERPLEKVASDITYIKHQGKWFFLVCFLDLFNNEVVEWKLSESLHGNFVSQSAKRLLEKAKCTGIPILMHSDQGNQYKAIDYRVLLTKYNAIQSMSRSGTPRDNTVIESFFGRFKEVLRAQFQYHKSDNLRDSISRTIDYFNFIRPIRKLNGKPPVQFRIEQVA